MTESAQDHTGARGLSWIWRLGLGLFLLLAVVILWPILSGRGPVLNLQPWSYPGASALTNVSGERFAVARLETGDDFPQVLNHYKRMLAIPGSGDPMFQRRHSVVLNLRKERTDIVLISSGLKTQDKVTTLMERKGDRLLIMHITRAMGDVRTSILLAMVHLPEGVLPEGFPPQPMLDDHRYPGSQRLAGGTLDDLKSFQYSAQAGLEEVWRYFMGTNDVPSAAAGAPVEGTEAAWRSRWPVCIPLPVAEHEGLGERAVIFLGPWGAFSVHAAQASPEDLTHMVMTLAH